MTNETVFLGECPIIRPEGIWYGGQRVIRFGMGGVGLGDVGDLLAYRQEWEPFIAAYLTQWRQVNDLFEQNSGAKDCPAGVFTPDQIKIDPERPTAGAFCLDLAITRMYVSDTHPQGILTRWNAWKDKSSIDTVAGAPAMLQWMQEVVMRVSGPDKDALVKIAKRWNVDVELPNLPSFSTQQEIISRIEGAYVTTKGVLQILGYGTAEVVNKADDKTGVVLEKAGDVAQALAKGLTDTAAAIPKAVNWALVAGAVAVAVGGGALIVYYVPRRSAPAALPPRYP